MIFHENHLQADDPHEKSYLVFFRKLRKMLQNLSSVAVMIGALRVKRPYKDEELPLHREDHFT